MGNYLKKFAAAGLCLCLSFALPATAGAAWDPVAAGVPVSSASVFPVNTETGMTVYEKNIDEIRRPASLTKMMTCLLLVESNPNLDEVVTIPPSFKAELDKIEVENGASLLLSVGEQLRVRDLLYSAMLPSANDAASLIAYYLSNGDMDAFIARMNERAAELGCTDTRFICAHGLYEEEGGNWSTAQDMEKITAACAANDALMAVARTAVYELPYTNLHTAAKTYYDGTVVPDGIWQVLPTTNLLQTPDSPFYRPYTAGVKTGFTDAAGRCLATTAAVDGTGFILVMMGCPNEYDEGARPLIYTEATALLDWATSTLRVGEAVEPDKLLATLPADDCKEAGTVDVYPSGSITTLLDGSTAYTLTLPERLQAPLTAGQTVGSAGVVVNHETVGTVDLIVRDARAYSWTLHLKNQITSWWNGLWNKAAA